MSTTRTADQPSVLTFLKLGGSLLTDKAKANTYHPRIMARLAREMAAAINERSELRIVLGHGSGSFGHVAASKYNTAEGVQTPEQWRGFAEVRYQAARLNHLVTDALRAGGLPCITFPPSAMVTAKNGNIQTWDLQPVRRTLHAGLMPVVYGDVVFDTHLGGTILSTESLFRHLAPLLQPQRILIAGLEPGVWSDYPARTHLIPEITPQNIAEVLPALSGAHGVDVTGGMITKVKQMLALVENTPGLEVIIFSGKEPGALKRVLLGAKVGTTIKSLP